MRILHGEQTKPVSGLGFTPDGRTLVAGGLGGFDVYDLAAQSHRHFAAPKARAAFDLVVDPLGRWVYLSLTDVGCGLYDLHTGASRPLPDARPGEDVVSLAASADGRLLATSCRRPDYSWQLTCWAIEKEGRLRPRWREETQRHSGCFLGLAFEPGGARLATVDESAGHDQGRYAVRLRDAASGARLPCVEARANYVAHIDSAFTPDGRRLFVWDERMIVAADLAGDSVKTFAPPGRAHLRWLAVHPSGRFFVTVANDGVARYWDAQSLTQTQGFKWKAGKLSCVAFNHDGTLAAAGTESGKVVLWDVDD
jgi:WD40 repeat protein